MPEHGVQFSKKGAIIYQSPTWKVGVLVLIFEEGLRLPISDFINEVMREYGFSVDELTPNFVNKIVGFELAC